MEGDNGDEASSMTLRRDDFKKRPFDSSLFNLLPEHARPARLVILTLLKKLTSCHDVSSN